jgi:radical SAM superfamily enzyme YgiQ (UPF0313 family)
MTRASVLDILRKAKTFGWRVVLGGPEPANYLGEYLGEGADAIVIGEGEQTLADLLHSYRQACSNLSQIPGLAFLDDDHNVHVNVGRSLLSDLDLQPWPARESIDLHQYLSTWREHHGASSVSLITARGCPYHCRWCSHSVYGKTHRRRSVTGVVNEIEWIRSHYDPDMFWFADDVFTIHHPWLFEFCRQMRERHCILPFECITRADRINEKVADTLAELGCFRVWIGSESGSQRILDAMERGVRVEEVQRSVQLCKDRGIQVGMFLMWGYAGEELSDIEATVEHVKRSDPDVFLTTVAYPIKGTGYFDDVSPSLLTPEVWAASTDRDWKIRGRRPRGYYQFADQLLKSEVALGRLLRDAGPGSTSPQLDVLRQSAQTARKGLHELSSHVEA